MICIIYRLAMTRIDPTDAISTHNSNLSTHANKGLYRPITARYSPLLTHQMDIYMYTLESDIDPYWPQSTH